MTKRLLAVSAAPALLTALHAPAVTANERHTAMGVVVYFAEGGRPKMGDAAAVRVLSRTFQSYE